MVLIFYQVRIPAGNHHRDLVQCPLCWKSWSPVENQVIFLIKNQVEYLPCPLLKCQSRNLLKFLVVSQVIILVDSHKFMWVCIPVFCQVLHQPKCLNIFEARKPVKIQALIHYRLQLVWQVWFHLFKLVTSQPMLQVCNQAVYKVMELPVLQYCILSSTLVYKSHKLHPILPVSISVPSVVVIHQPPSSYISIECSIHWENFTVTKFCV